ncbi:MAG: hypothetical protein KF782_28970 [Labilithrix sp.]|nr:hypothetical protein [Labilithrix sp.]
MRAHGGRNASGRAGAFDLDGFRAAVDAERRARGQPWSAVAAETGVSPSTLTRMARGRGAEVDALAALALWAGVSLDAFVRPARAAPAGSAGPRAIGRVAAELRRDPELGEREALAIAEIVAVAYEKLRRP